MPLKDKTKRLAYQRAYYHRTKSTRYERDKPRLERNRKRQRANVLAWYDELKASLVCNRCGENHPGCLVFHHRDPKAKEITVAEAVHSSWGSNRILREIAKCEVLCANCHIKHHVAERNR